MTVRCKFRLTEIHRYTYNVGSAKFIFEPIYDTTIEADRRFSDATPTGKFEIQVNNPAVIESYKLGDYYYFDSTPVSA